MNIPSLSVFTLILVPLISSSESMAAENLVANPGFEQGDKDWRLYMAKESEDKEAKIETDTTVFHSGQSSLRLFSVKDARYSAGPRVSISNVNAGDRFRVSVWVRAGDDFVQNKKTPGFYVRLTQFVDPGEDPIGVHYHFGLGNKVLLSASPAPLGTNRIPDTWQEVGGVVEVTKGAARIGLNIFVERGSGTVYIDDVSLVKVSADTPLSSLLPGSK